MATFGFDQVHFIIILSISTATATSGGGVPFFSRCPFFHRERERLANLGDFVANLSTFWNALSGLNHALVSQNWQISGMHCPSFLFFWSFSSLLSKPWSVCFRSENWFALQVESALAKFWNGFHRWYIRFVAILTILSMTLFYFNSNKREIALYARNGLFLILKDKRYAATF